MAAALSNETELSHLFRSLMKKAKNNRKSLVPVLKKIEEPGSAKVMEQLNNSRPPKIREFHTRKMNRTLTMTDQFHRLHVTSDPLISFFIMLKSLNFK